MAKENDWINNELFEEIFAKNYDSDKILEVICDATGGKGENYASQMFKAKINYESNGVVKTKNVMVKSMSTDESVSQMLGAMNVFPKEKEIYKNIIPGLEELLKEIGEDIQFGPKCLSVGSSPLDYIIMEDLSIDNYKCEDRRTGLDLKHCEILMEKLAKFHAASAVFHEKNGPYHKIFNEGMFMESMADMYKQMGVDNNNKMFDVIETWPGGIGKKYVDILRPWKFHFIDAIFKATKQNPDGGLNVLAHGDCHTNNIMFTHDEENNITSCLLVDFQMSYWTSPVIDLLYFLVGSPALEVKVKHFDHLVYHYYKILVSTLRKLGYKKKIPTAIDLHIDILQRGAMAIMNCLQVLPIMLLDPSEDNKMENFMKTDEEAMRFKDTLYNNPRYITQMNELFIFFENKGFLELELTPLNPKSPSEWLNKEFFKDILVDNYGSTEILNVVVTSTGGAGENYASMMFKADVTYKINDEIKSEYFIVKSMHTNEQESQMLTAFGIFPKEMEMYEKNIPILEAILKDGGEDIQFGARCFKTGSEPLEYIVMEDLTRKNFKCEVRQEGLDLEHSKAILEKLAKFHAASAICYEINGPFSEKFNEGMLNEKLMPMFKEMGETNHQIMVDIIREWPDIGEKYANILEPLKTRLFEEAVKVVKKNPEPGFNVLCHGDLWTNNFMYTHDEENNIKEVLMVDYQMCFWSSPAIDLLYFIVGSPKLDIKINEFDTLVHHYYTILVQTLKKLKYQKKIPSLTDLHVDILRRGVFGLMNCFGVMTVILLDPNSDCKMENIMNSDEAGLKFKQRMFTNPRFIEHAKKLLPFFEKKGILHLDDE